MNTRIALVDDKAVNRQSFINKLQLFSDLENVITAVNGDDFLSQLKNIPQQKMPQVAFIDLEMPVMDGIQTIGITKALYPEIHCIVLTVFDDDAKIFEAIKAGAAGYLLKDENKISIYDAIQNVLEYGGAPMSPGIARKAFDLLHKAQNISSLPEHVSDETEKNILSERENEILHYTINGWDAKRISSVLNISVHTVRKHIANIYEKLHVTSKAQIIQLAYKNNWIKAVR
jgi:DNA-binding NarL/FixJ family response regulator